jgi:hypothetical protein
MATIHEHSGKIRENAFRPSAGQGDRLDDEEDVQTARLPG